MIMNKRLIPCITILCLVLVPLSMTEANTKPDPVRMQRHVDKVKITHPAEYKDMLEKAGGVIVDCTSCHGDMKTKKRASEYRFPRSPRR